LQRIVSTQKVALSQTRIKSAENEVKIVSGECVWLWHATCHQL